MNSERQRYEPLSTGRTITRKVARFRKSIAVEGHIHDMTLNTKPSILPDSEHFLALARQLTSSAGVANSHARCDRLTDLHSSPLGLVNDPLHPDDYVGIVEKLWSSGSVGEGRIIALKINEFCAKESCCVRSRDRTNRKPVAARELNASYAANNKLQKAVESEVTSSPR
jgi:hypothetical protein